MSSVPNPPFDAYHGEEPYIFVSYAHKDGALVFSEIERLHRLGFRLWYDEGIDPGMEWPEEIARAIENAAYFLVFISESSVQSVNVKNEINFALNLEKPFLAIHLAEIDMPPGLRLRMADIQAILKWQLLPDHYHRKLLKALPSSTCDARKGLLPEPEFPSKNRVPSTEKISPSVLPKFKIPGVLKWILLGIGGLSILSFLGYKLEVTLDQKTGLNALVLRAGPTVNQPWTNSLGMKLAPAGSDGILFGVWDVRKKDFRAYAEATGYQQTGGIEVLTVQKNDQGGHSISWELDPNASWEHPRFEQTPLHPVVGVSWQEAKAFCRWLTQKERNEKLLNPTQFYRLPYDKEWSQAVGSGKYPWGDAWPPPDGAGNYGDETFSSSMPITWTHVPGNDGYARTSPVGSFKANAYGLYDMGGNVWQWCEDTRQTELANEESDRSAPISTNPPAGEQTQKILRGASWGTIEARHLASAYRIGRDLNCRRSYYGFRVVLVVAP